MDNINTPKSGDKTGVEDFAQGILDSLHGNIRTTSRGVIPPHPDNPDDMPPGDMPPLPSPSQLMGAGAEYTEDDNGFNMPSITYANRTELFHLMLDLVGDNTRALAQFYRQGRIMVRVDEGGSVALDANALAGEIEQRVVAQKRVGSKAPVTDLFPLQVVKMIAASPHLCTHVRPLAGVTGVPFFRPDGSICATDGYDPVTQYVLWSDDNVKFNVPDEPTDLDVAQAVQTILAPLDGFPFVSDADCNAWIGMALTPMMRFYTPGPYKLGLIGAHQAGSGKTYLASMLAELYGGQVHAMLPEEDAEIRKIVTGVLQEKGGVIVFDNVEGKIAQPALAALLTSPKWSGRLLSKNVNVTLDNDRMWVVTGNNVTIDGDMARRVLKCMIDPGMSNPELRKFGFNPVQWVREHRAEYLSALGTLIRAWIAAGSKLGNSPGSDSYALWRQTIHGVLDHAGLSGGFDPLENRVTAGQGDEEWQEFLSALWDRFGETEWKAADLVETIRLDKFPKELLPGSLAHKWNPWETAGFSKSLGHWMRNRVGKWVGEYTVFKEGKDGHTKAQLWRVGKMQRGAVE